MPGVPERRTDYVHIMIHRVILTTSKTSATVKAPTYLAWFYFENLEDHKDIDTTKRGPLLT
jgi:hypothetical protein